TALAYSLTRVHELVGASDAGIDRAAVGAPQLTKAPTATQAALSISQRMSALELTVGGHLDRVTEWGIQDAGPAESVEPSALNASHHTLTLGGWSARIESAKTVRLRGYLAYD